MTIRLADELAGRVKPTARTKPESKILRPALPAKIARRVRALAMLRIPHALIAEAVGASKTVVGDIALGRHYRGAGQPSCGEVEAAARFLARYVMSRDAA